MDRSSVHLFCSSCSSSASASDAERRVVDHAVARSVSAVHRLSSNTPLFIRGSINFYTARWAKKKAKMAMVKTAASKGRFRVKRIHPGSFSAQTGKIVKTRPLGRALLASTWHAEACSSVLKYLCAHVARCG